MRRASLSVSSFAVFVAGVTVWGATFGATCT